MSISFLPSGGIPGQLIAPVGTRLAFNQPAAPNGWLIDAAGALADCSIRINQGTAGNTGGTTLWSNWNGGGTFNVNTFTLNTTQLPSHSHTITDGGHVHGITDGGHNHGFGGPNVWSTGGSPTITVGSTGTTMGQISGTASNTSGIGMNVATTGIAGTNAAGNGVGITPSYITPSVKFTDFLIAVKT